MGGTGLSLAGRLKGVAGAALGALLGVALWVFMDASGYFVFLAGTAVSFFAGRGMMLACRRVDRASFVQMLAIAFPSFVLALFLSRDVVAALTMAQEGWAVDVARVARDTFRIAFAHGAGPFVKDGLFGLAFFALGALDFVNVLGENGVGLFKRRGAPPQPRPPVEE